MGLSCSALVLALLGCSAEAPSPSVLSVSPKSFTAGDAIQLTITGSDFHPVLSGDLSQPEQTKANLAFGIALTEGDIEVPLRDIVWVHDGELRGWTPADLLPGSYAVRVVDPRGASAKLASAISVLRAEDLIDPPPIDPPPIDPPPDPDPVPTNLELHLEFEDGSGTTALDRSGNRNDGTLEGDVTWTTGPAGGAVQVDYTDGRDFVRLPSSVTLDDVQEGSYTLSSWFRPDSTPPGTGSDPDAYYGILIKVGWNNGLHYSNDNRFRFTHWLTDEVSLDVVSADTFAPGRFFHVAGVVDRNVGTVELYVDGQLQGSITFTPGSAARGYDTNTWKVGVANSNGGEWSWAAHGAFDDVRIYSRALPPAEVAGLATPNSAPTDVWVTSTDSGGLSINQDGGNDAYFIADDGEAILGGLTKVTAEIRFALDSINNSAYLASYATDSHSDSFRLGIHGLLGELRILIGDARVDSTAMDYRTLANGAPHTLSVTWDGSSGLWEVFVDGALVDSGSGFNVGSSIAGGNGALVFGNEQDSVNGGYDLSSLLSATLHDVRFFDTARTAGEIAANHDQTVASTEAGLLANWTFSDLSTDGVVTDAVSSNNLRLQHVAAAGFSSSTPSLTLEVSENAANGTFIGTVAGIDPDPGDTLSCALTDNAAGRFAIDSGCQLTVADGTLLDCASASSHHITVRVTDAGGLTHEEAVTVFTACVP